jgi:hypothetical protein
VLSLLREILDTCHDSISPYAIYTKHSSLGTNDSNFSADELIIKTLLNDHDRVILKSLVEKRGLKMQESEGVVKIFRSNELLLNF